MTWLPIAGCAVCAANETSGGWFILAGTVVLAGAGIAAVFAWLDRGR
jgi:hypothetical protein